MREEKVPKQTFSNGTMGSINPFLEREGSHFYSITWRHIETSQNDSVGMTLVI